MGNCRIWLAQQSEAADVFDEMNRWIRKTGDGEESTTISTPRRQRHFIINVYTIDIIIDLRRTGLAWPCPIPGISLSLSLSQVFSLHPPFFLSFFLSLSFDLFSFPFVSRYSPLPIFSPLINEWWRRGWPQMAEVSLGRHFSFMFAFGSSSAVFPPLIQQYLFNSSNYYSLFVAVAVAVAVAVVEWTTKPFWEKANWFWKWNWKFLHVGKWITR